MSESTYGDAVESAEQASGRARDMTIEQAAELMTILRSLSERLTDVA